LVDEFDVNEIKEIVSSLNLVLIQGYAGTGKSFAYKNLLDETLFTTPYNALCKDIRDGGKNAVTLHKMLGLKYDDIEVTKMNSYDVSNVEVIIFDEIFLYDTFKLGLIKEYINKHPEIRFYATGECNQLPAIEKLVIKDKREYYKNVIYSIFPNVIELTKNKRCKTEEDREKMDSFIQDILNSTGDKKELLDILKKYDIKIIGNIKDIHTKKNICHMNSSCEFVNKLVMNKYHPDKKYIVGEDLICRKTLQIKKAKTYVNYTYKIIEIKDESMILNDDDEDIEVSKELIEKHFKLPYARTCSSVQGMTIDENITIFDFYNNFVDKYWLYTAITRTTELKNVSIFVGKQKDLTEYINGKIVNMIKFHKESDAKACREWNGNYIDLDFVLEEFKNTSNCRYCGEPIDIYGDECFSIDRIDNDLPHIKTNCQIICVTCNKSKK
jgi:ATP-dependent exoDNAse (exonuclease V) alpha subunit